MRTVEDRAGTRRSHSRCWVGRAMTTQERRFDHGRSSADSRARRRLQPAVPRARHAHDSSTSSAASCCRAGWWGVRQLLRYRIGRVVRELGRRGKQYWEQYWEQRGAATAGRKAGAASAKGATRRDGSLRTGATSFGRSSESCGRVQLRRGAGRGRFAVGVASGHRRLVRHAAPCSQQACHPGKQLAQCADRGCENHKPRRRGACWRQACREDRQSSRLARAGNTLGDWQCR